MTGDREISAGLIIYRKTLQGIKYLIMYHGGGYWNFPKGKLETSEKGMDAAFREVKEETGLSKNDLYLRSQFRLTDKYIFFRHYERIFKIVIFYLVQTSKREITISHEHDGYAWFTYKEAMKVLRFQNIKNITKQANALLTKKQQPA